MKVRWDPQQQRFPALAGKLVVDTFRGAIRVRRWPKKRGTPKSAAVRRQNVWFKGANELAKVVEPTQQNLAIAMTLGTGLYPRDLLLRQMAGGMYELIASNGQILESRRRWRETVVFQGAILENTAVQVLGTSVWRALIWQLPVIDTQGYWNVANPTELTIPEGVEIVGVAVSLAAVGAGAEANMTMRILLNGVDVGSIKTRITGFLRLSCARGGMVVLPGDIVTVEVFVDQARSSQADPSTSLTLTVLQAA